jgi:hypothetical protein
MASGGDFVNEVFDLTKDIEKVDQLQENQYKGRIVPFLW